MVLNLSPCSALAHCLIDNWSTCELFYIDPSHPEERIDSRLWPATFCINSRSAKVVRLTTQQDTKLQRVMNWPCAININTKKAGLVRTCFKQGSKQPGTCFGNSKTLTNKAQNFIKRYVVRSKRQVSPPIECQDCTHRVCEGNAIESSRDVKGPGDPCLGSII